MYVCMLYIYCMCVQTHTNTRARTHTHTHTGVRMLGGNFNAMATSPIAMLVREFEYDYIAVRTQFVTGLLCFIVAQVRERERCTRERETERERERERDRQTDRLTD